MRKKEYLEKNTKTQHKLLAVPSTFGNDCRSLHEVARNDY